MGKTMTYEEYFEETKQGLKFYYEKLSDEELVAYMQSEEDVIRNKYELQKSQYEAGDKNAFNVSGVVFCLYMLYE